MGKGTEIESIGSGNDYQYRPDSKYTGNVKHRHSRRSPLSQALLWQSGDWLLFE